MRVILDQSDFGLSAPPLTPAVTLAHAKIVYCQDDVSILTGDRRPLGFGLDRRIFISANADTSAEQVLRHGGTKVRRHMKSATAPEALPVPHGLEQGDAASRIESGLPRPRKPRPIRHTHPREIPANPGWAYLIIRALSYSLDGFCTEPSSVGHGG